MLRKRAEQRRLDQLMRSCCQLDALCILRRDGCLHHAHGYPAPAYRGVVEAPDGREEDRIVGTPPEPEALAHRLLHHMVEGDEGSAALVAASVAAHGRLRAGLSVFFGQVGFDALWARAMALVPQSVLAGVGVDALMLRSSDRPDVLSGRTQDELRSVVHAAFTSFIGLLFTFVGAELGSRLLHQVWPELPLDAPSTSTGDVPR